MITDHLVIRDPSIDMHMLNLRPPSRNLRTDKDLINLLTVLPEQVGISLWHSQAGRVIDVDHARDALERLDGRDTVELVEVARDNDGGVGVEREDLLDEVLLVISFTSRCRLCNMKSGKVDLHRRSSIALPCPPRLHSRAAVDRPANCCCPPYSSDAD